MATFIKCIGPGGLYIYNALPFANEDETQQMDKVIELFERHCLGETNIIYERFTFNRRDQAENEDFDMYLTALREQVRRCEFQGMEDEMLRNCIVCGVLDNALRRQLLQKENLTLQSCVDMCRISEATARHLRVVGGDEDVHRVQNQPSRSFQPCVPGQRKNMKARKARLASYSMAAVLTGVWLVGRHAQLVAS